MHPEFPYEGMMALYEEEGEDEDKEKCIVWFDGASNILGHGIGAVFVSPDKQCLSFMARLCLDCTNNMAEYIMALFEEKGEDEDKEKWILWSTKHAPWESEQQSTLGLSCSKCIGIQHW